MERNVIIMGCRGYTRNYGGWETLVHHLVDNWPSSETRFYVFELSHDPKEKEIEVVNGVTCIRIFLKKSRSATMLYMDAIVLLRLKKFIDEYKLRNPILLDLGVRCGELYPFIKNILKKRKVKVVSNSDGMGWRRTKYSKLIAYRNRLSALVAYRFGVDCLVNDCAVMQEYYEKYWANSKHHPILKMIPYGTHIAPKLEPALPEKVKRYFDEHNIIPDHYYLMVSRFVPENSYEMILSEYVNSSTACDFIVICNNNQEAKFYQLLSAKIPFEKDARIKFVGTLYDKDILAYLRQHARGYINGHTVGGTNPGLLESLATTDVNIVRDCSFSREGAADAALYFSEEVPMRDILVQCDNMTAEERKALGEKAKERMATLYTWEGVCREYYELFESLN